MATLQVWASIATILSLIIALISLIISFYAKNKVSKLETNIKTEVGRLETKITKIKEIKGGTNIINPNIENINIYSKTMEGKKNE